MQTPQSCFVPKESGDEFVVSFLLFIFASVRLRHSVGLFVTYLYLCTIFIRYQLNTNLYMRYLCRATASAFLCVLFLVASCGDRSKSPSLDKELRKLDEMVKKANNFDRKKYKSIDSAKHQLKALGDRPSVQRWRLYEELGDKFKNFSSDSSVIYYGKAYDEALSLGNDSLQTISRIDHINALSAAGIFAGAQSMLATIDTTGMSMDFKIRYALAGRQLYSYMTSYVTGHEQLYPDIEKNLESYTDYLLKNMDPSVPFCRLLEYERLVNTGRYAEAKPLLESFIATLPQESNLYGRAAYQLAVVNQRIGTPDQYAYMLVLAAESDLQAAVKEGMALPMLAEWLYQNGDTERAYKYINLSMKDASSGNARMRTGMIADAITMIDNSYKQKVESSRLWITISLIVAVCLLIAAAVMLVLVIKQKRKVVDGRQKLSNLTRRQESYIGHFIALCAYYSDKLSSMSRTVDRKISSGQGEDLLKMIKSGKFADEHNEDFFDHFDKVFLDLYPDFVEEVNKLLRPDSRITLKNESSLTAELRIYAFVRLGVDESVKISRILRYSPATIYTYRNKMRNRAINRDTFEEDIMKIGSFS